MINKLFLIMSSLIFISGVLSFSFNQKFILSSLMSIEFMMLSMLILMIILMFFNMEDMYMIMNFLIMSVCEGVLGLSILVSMIRTHGNNFFNSIYSSMC